MAVYTAIHGAQDSLKALIDALSSTDLIPVDLGFPGRVLEEHIWISGDVDEDEQTYRVSGLAAKDETFTLRVHVVITSRTDDYADPRNAVRTVTRAIETMVNQNPTLSGTVWLAEVERHLLDEAIPDEQSRQVMATLFVKCQAWQA